MPESHCQQTYMLYVLHRSLENIRQTDLLSSKNTGAVCGSSLPILAMAVASVGKPIAVGHTSQIST